MKKYFNIQFLFIVLAFAISIPAARAQDRNEQLEEKLAAMAEDIPELNEKIDISVSDVSVQEFLRAVANNVGLNMNVDPSLSFDVINNYTNVRVVDVLYFLCTEYNLDVNAVGNIISVNKYKAPEIKEEPVVKEIRVDYYAAGDSITIDVNNDTLQAVTRKITDVTGKNIVLSPGLQDRVVSGYIKAMPFESALQKLAFANNLDMTKTRDNYYVIEDAAVQTSAGGSRHSGLYSEEDIETFEGIYYEIRNSQNLSIKANEVSVIKMLKLISDSLKINYSIISGMEGTASLSLFNVNYTEFLHFLFEGTNYGFYNKNGIYVFGDKSSISLKTTETIMLQHRSVNKISEVIPVDLKEGIEIIEFPELNSLFLTGNPVNIERLKMFIRSIDKVVPVILIEVIIVDVLKGYTVSTGISAGMGEVPEEQQAGQTFMPGIDYQLSTAQINALFEKINGLGSINLGKVSPDFYLTLKAMEDNNYIKIRSTPKLSTLNGHEATLSSGEIRYYKEERNNFIGTQNPALSSSFTWKPINADLSITLTPYVSGDEQITLEIDVQQAEFQQDNSTDAPPGSVNRGFKSQIRMKNQEMILLGGLDKLTQRDVSTGVPLLSRIPVLKWIFSSKTKEKADNKLNVFIQPTIIY